MANASTPDLIRSVAERAASAGICVKTLYNEINRGAGPVVTRPSRNRIGISDSNWRAWLKSRETGPAIQQQQEGERPAA